MKKRNLFYVIETLLSILILIALVTAFVFVFDYRNKNVLGGDWVWDSNKVKMLESENDDKIAVYNLNPSSSSDIYRIVVIGDSVVYAGCPSVDAIEEKLNKEVGKLKIGKRTISNFNVVNAAYPSHIEGIADRLKIIRQNNIRIDMLLLLSGWNEHWYKKSSNPCVKANCYRDLTMYRWLLNLTKNDNKRIKNLATNIFISKRDKDYIFCESLFEDDKKNFLKGLDHYNTSIYRISLDSYEEELVKIIEDIRGKGSEIIIVTPPDALTRGAVPKVSLKDCTLLDDKSYFDVHHLYVNKAREVANELGIQILDLDILFEEISDYKTLLFNNATFDPIHPNRLGNQYCTEFYYQTIISELMKNQNKLEG